MDIIGENPIFSDFDLQAEDTPNCKEILWIDFLKVQTVVRETLKEIQEIIDELALAIELREWRRRHKEREKGKVGMGWKFDKV